jgi:hypothetical protein
MSKISNYQELNQLMANPPARICEKTREFQRACPTLKRGCAACGLKRTEAYGPDPCLGYLPGVQNACCGHGIQYGYVQFENGLTIRGVFHTDDGPGPATNR